MMDTGGSLVTNFSTAEEEVHLNFLHPGFLLSVRHVAIGESNQELAKRNLCIFANLAKSIK